MLTEQSLLTPSGIGPIQIGMTVAEAAEAGAVELIGYGDASEPGTCTYVRPESGPPELDFMVIDDRIVRVDARFTVFHEVEGQPISVDVGENSQILTSEGIGLGTSEAEVKAAYPEAEISGHRYIPDGHYLMITDPTTPDHSLIFETDGHQVTYIRSGRSPEVQWVERCG